MSLLPNSETDFRKRATKVYYWCCPMSFNTPWEFPKHEKIVRMNKVLPIYKSSATKEPVIQGYCEFDEPLPYMEVQKIMYPFAWPHVHWAYREEMGHMPTTPRMDVETYDPTPTESPCIKTKPAAKAKIMPRKAKAAMKKKPKAEPATFKELCKSKTLEQLYQDPQDV